MGPPCPDRAEAVDTVGRRLDVECVVYLHPSTHLRKAPDKALVVVRRVDVRRVFVPTDTGQPRNQLWPLPDQRAAANITLETLEVGPQLAYQHDRRMKPAVETQSCSGEA